MNRKEISLNTRISRLYAMRLFEIGRAQDLNKGGYCDAGGTAINFWCGPDSHPECWNGVEITQGALDHPREFVGTLRLEWVTDNHATLTLEASPYRVERRTKGRPTPEDLDDCLKWLKVKAEELFALADAHPDILGTKCPFCEHVLPNGHLINDLCTHITEVHKLPINELVLGDPYCISTNRGVFQLQTVYSGEKHG